jgi:hypothetical protein
VSDHHGPSRPCRPSYPRHHGCRCHLTLAARPLCLALLSLHPSWWVSAPKKKGLADPAEGVKRGGRDSATTGTAAPNKRPDWDPR